MNISSRNCYLLLFLFLLILKAFTVSNNLPYLFDCLFDDNKNSVLWEGLSGGCRAGLTLERCSQLAAFVIRPVG